MGKKMQAFDLVFGIMENAGGVPMDVRTIEKLIRKYLLFAAVLILIIINFDRLLGYLHVIRTAFSSILFAAMFAYIVNLILVRLERLLSLMPNAIIQKVKRPVSLVLSLAIVAFILYALVGLIFPILFDSINILVNALPAVFDQIQSFLVSLSEDYPDLGPTLEELQFDWQMVLGNLLSLLGDGVGEIFSNIIGFLSTLVGSVFNILLIVIFSIYILLDKERFIRMYERLSRLYMNQHEKRRVDTVLGVFHQTFSSFIAGQFIEAIILSTLCAAGMFLLRMPYPVMVGILVGFINIIPIVGAYAGGAIGMFLVFTVDPLLSIGFLVYLVILQQFESNVIYPRVVGNSVGLPGIFVLGSVIVFGALAGVLGMFLGIPIVASFYKLAKLYLEAKERNMPSVPGSRMVE